MKKKILSSGLAVAMTLAMTAAPAMAATDSQAVIDTNRTGTINIHKLIENDGKNVEAYGIKNADESRIPVNMIGYDYVQVADIASVRGIVISENGAISSDWLRPDGGSISVGTYYRPRVKDDKNMLDELADKAKIVPPAIYIKTAISGDDPSVAPTIQYEFQDQRLSEATNLAAEQAAVDSAKEALDTAKANLDAARAANMSAYSTNVVANSNKARAEAALNAAAAAVDAAQAKADTLDAEMDTATDALDAATEGLATATASFNDAKDAFDEAEANYSTGDESTQRKLADAKADYQNAANALSSAQQNLIDAQNQLSVAQDNSAKATASLEAAQVKMAEALQAKAAAALGDPDTIDGVQQMLASASAALAEAEQYNSDMNAALEAAQAAKDSAQSDLETAASDLDSAQEALQTATSNDTAAYNAFKSAMDALRAAKTALDNATTAQETAQADFTSIAAQKAAADQALEEAQAAKDAAQERLNELTQQASDDGAAATAANADMEAAKTAYDQAWSDYKAAVAALDTKAAAEGIEKVYSAESVQNMLKQIVATLGEDEINKWVEENTDFVPKTATGDGKYTDDNGDISFTGLPIGLYLVAETDITYHDGIAGAWSDGVYPEDGNHINNDQQNVYSGEAGSREYTIYPIDGHADDSTHVYQEGEVYREAVNPEYPVIESKSSPFFVSIPTTNMTDTTVDMVDPGDNYGAMGSVWQYAVDVYPKNQTMSGVYLRIVDPDESLGVEKLRTSEDYQMGDVISQVMWSEAPALQPNYLDPTAPGNQHTSYVLSVKTTPGVTFDRVTGVDIIPASQLKGENDISNSAVLYYDPDGNLVSADEAIDPNTGELKTIHKYYDSYGHEVSQDVYEAASATNVDKGEYTDRTFTYKKYETIGNGYNSGMPDTVYDLAVVKDGAEDEGISLTPEDYDVIITDDQDIILTDADGNSTVAVPAGTHGFAVVLNENGLAKLNDRPTNSIVVVHFDSILNNQAAIGQYGTDGNMSTGTLHWINSNTKLNQVGSNEIYDYTYELNIQKKGVDDATQVKFVVSRDDTGDVGQAAEKDLTDADSWNPDKGTGLHELEQDDSIKFVEEAPGVYHVWGYLSGENTDEGDPAASENPWELTEINGTQFATVTPAADGSILLKGLDSDSYTFKEVQTEAGKNLLKSTFTVKYLAADENSEEPLTNTRDGRLRSATVKTGDGEEIDITIGLAGRTFNDRMDNNQGIASMTVNNFSVIDLRTGGAGRTMILVAGGVLLAAMGAGFALVSRKKKHSEQ